jgi:hypothetical protein
VKLTIKILFGLILVIFIIDLLSENEAVNLISIDQDSESVKNQLISNNINIYDESSKYKIPIDIVNKLNLDLNECIRINEIVGTYVREQTTLIMELDDILNEWNNNDQSTDVLKQAKADLVDKYAFKISEITTLYEVIIVTLQLYPDCFDEDLIGSDRNNPNKTIYRTIQLTEQNKEADRKFFAETLYYLLLETEYEPITSRIFNTNEVPDR